MKRMLLQDRMISDKALIEDVKSLCIRHGLSCGFLADPLNPNLHALVICDERAIEDVPVMELAEVYDIRMPFQSTPRPQ